MRLWFELSQSGDWVGDDRRDWLALVDDAVDKRGVGAVLQEPPYQIGEQILMAADRRVDPARLVHLLLPDDLLVKRCAHAVQALEFPRSARSGELEHRGEGVRVM